MSKSGIINDVIEARQSRMPFDRITVGIVIDTNDPQQMGRVRVFCPNFGDQEDRLVRTIPWAVAASPLAGSIKRGTRGTDATDIIGTTAYGMWNIPIKNSRVLVSCIDGDPNSRVWLGCIHDQYQTHTLPHGRYLHENGENGTPDGPLTSEENQIEPLYSHQTSTFTNSSSKVPSTPSNPRKNLEWRTRGADTQAAAIGQHHLTSVDSNEKTKKDDDFNYTFTEEDSNVRFILGQGYDISHLNPDETSKYTQENKNYDSHTYSWTTPGLHAIAMDDREWNCRMRFRTTGGNQIILDDTNERIYISTAEGNTWIEFDQQGHIDIFGAKDFSLRAEGDINLKTEKKFRVHAKEGIHMVSDDEMRLHAKAGKGMHIKSNTTMHMESNNEMHVLCHGSSLFLTSDNEMDIYAGANGHFTTGAILHLLSGENMYLTAGPDIHLNGPAASSAFPADNAWESFIPSREPEHEPWARSYSDPLNADQELDNTFVSKPATYTDKDIGRKDRDDAPITRNKNWHR